VRILTKIGYCRSVESCQNAEGPTALGNKTECTAGVHAKERCVSKAFRTGKVPAAPAAKREENAQPCERRYARVVLAVFAVFSEERRHVVVEREEMQGRRNEIG